MTNKQIKLSKRNNWATYYFVFMCIIIVWNLLMQECSVDDSVVFFSKMIATDSLSDLLQWRYEAWTSRIFIEAILFPISTNFVLWKIFNILLYALFAYCLLYLTNFKYNKLILGLWLTYPIVEMSSAGWVATYLNYFWPLAVGTYSLILIYKIYYDKKIYPYEYFTFSFSTLFATNAEQADILFTGILLLFGFNFYLLHNEKRGRFIYSIQLLIAIGNMILILICPGNYVRSWTEIGSSMHDFGMLSFFDKVVLGVVDTMNVLITDNIIFSFFTIILFFVGINSLRYCSNTSNIYRTICKISFSFPLIITISLTLLKNTTDIYFSEALNILINYNIINSEDWYNFNNYITFIVYMLVLICIIISTIFIFNGTEGIKLSLLFIIGLTTRVVMGFSPTIYASGTRTFIFLEATLIYCIVKIFAQGQKLEINAHPIIKSSSNYLFEAVVVLSVINNTASICERVGL